MFRQGMEGLRGVSQGRRVESGLGEFGRCLVSPGKARLVKAGKVSQVTDRRVVLRNGRLEEKEG